MKFKNQEINITQGSSAPKKVTNTKGCSFRLPQEGGTYKTYEGGVKDNGLDEEVVVTPKWHSQDGIAKMAG